MAASAPVVAWFYREPRLVGITLVLSITFVLASSAVQHIALLNRQMRFRVIAMIDILSMLAGYLTAIGMALSEYGYWALVGASVTQVAIKLVLTWSISRWRPRLPSRNTQTRHLLSFGANITAGSLMYEFSQGADSLLIGRFFGAAAIGLAFVIRGGVARHPRHAAAATIHRANQCGADSGVVADTGRA